MHELYQAIVDGNPQVSITVSATELKQVVGQMWEELEASKQAEQPTPTQNNTPATGLLTRKQVIETMHVSSATLWRWQKIGYLVPVKLGTKVYYRQEHINALIENGYDETI